MSLPSLDILIVHWNSPGYLKDCLRSISASRKENFTINVVWVVDNASVDKDFSDINAYDLPIRLIENSTNIGFARANNEIGLNVTSKYLILVNPDVTFLEHTLDRLVRFMDDASHQSYGIVGPCMRLGNGALARECAQFPRLWTFANDILGLARLNPRVFKGFRLETWDHESSREVDHVMGGACFLRTEVFQKLSGFDTRYFLYYVDLDFSKRMDSAGLKSMYLREAEVVHKTDEIKEIGGPFRVYHSIRGRLLYASTHMVFLSWFVITLLSIFVEPGLRLLRALLSGKRAEMVKVYQTYALFFRN